MKKELVERIESADMILVGVGEEFEDSRVLKQLKAYDRQREKLREKMPWALMALNHYSLERGESRAAAALERLGELLLDKNYFVVSVAGNDFVWESGLNRERIVAPCGGSLQKQCEEGCCVEMVSGQERLLLKQCQTEESWEKANLGSCPICGKPMILNNIYASKYNENGYLGQWQAYTKWLQGTLNRRLCILELGVGLRQPSVVRWPFEKIGYFNKKADFIRVNERLWQMTQELADKGVSVACNAVDWLLEEEE